jgi:hypothetical protein
LSYVLKELAAKDKAARVVVCSFSASKDYDVDEFIRLLRVAVDKVMRVQAREKD